MIDIKRAEKNFLKYIEKYDSNIIPIEIKKKHSFRVMEVSKKLAESLNLELEKIDLATLIGLLHDIARFEQYTRFKTFNDYNSFDHGDYGVEILKESIRNYISIEKYDNVIKKAIKNHNKYAIEEGLNDEELLFSKIIRDADKLDLLYLATESIWDGTEVQINDQKVSDDVIEEFKSHKQIKKATKNREKVDSIVITIAFIFDLNFKESYLIIQKNNYINKILEKFNFFDIKTKKEFEEIKKIANNYILSKIEEMK